jgi:hypothetical protein
VTNFRWTATWALALGAGLVGCGGGTDLTKAQVRLVNASSGYATLDMRVDDAARQTGVAFGASASYVDIDPKKASTSLYASTSATALLSFDPSLSAKKYYTVLAYGAAGALKQLLLDDNNGAPDTNRTALRVVNAAPDAGALDVYITGSSDALSGAVASQSGAAVGAVGGYLNVNSGTWRLRITGAGSKTDVRLDVPALTLASKQVATLVLTQASGGVLVKALLLNQQASVDTLAATQARVRVAAGVADAGAVTASLGGVPLMSNTPSPAVNASYAVVEAAAQPLLVSVNGVNLVPPTDTLTAGGDYTLLVYGSAAAPLARWLVDDNNLSTNPGVARVRLVNGVTGLATPLALTVNLSPLANSVAAGTASGYGTLDATTAAAVSVTTSGAGSALFSAVDQTFSASSNYTVFVMGAASSPAGTVRKDR